MDNVNTLKRPTLKDWESWLAPQVRQVELLGEIPITAGECAQLGKAIGLRVRALGHKRALRILQRDYPCAFAVYLVAQGVYGYRGGDYWSEVVEVTGLKSGYTWQVGQVFEEILEDLGLPLFYDMRRIKALRYVSLILAHGGIPNYCLPDFFDKMLQPAATRAEYADMSAAELIDEWQWRSERKSILVDKPIIRFLVNGGEVAEEFVERCLEMAREYLDSGQVPGAEEIGLPARVVDAYGQWVSEREDIGPQDEKDRLRLRKPNILLDPWGEGVMLDLPPQQVPATMSHAEIVWRVTMEETASDVPVRIRRAGFDLKTTPESLVLDRPVAEYQVSLLADGDPKRTWRYPGVDAERPLLVFDQASGVLLPWKHSLPARCLWLLFPGQLDLQVEGQAHCLEELPRLPWGWAGFRGQCWNLESATSLILREDEQTVLSIAVRPDETAKRPYLVGGRLFSPGEPGVRPPVYVGQPPHIRVPLTGRRSADEELARWRLMVRSKWAAIPQIQRTLPLTDLRRNMEMGDGYFDVPLHLGRLLGKAPYGNFIVRLRGPLGRSAELPLRILPHLEICGHENLYLPEAQSGPPAVTLLVETPPGDGLECRGEDGECLVRATEQRADGWEYAVEAAPDVTGVELTVVRQPPTGDAIRVPVFVPIRRLRWALAGEQTGPALRKWSGQAIKRPVDALLQAESPCLLVELPVDDAQAVQMTLRLLDIDAAELQRSGPQESRRGQRLWRFELPAFLDTIRESRSPILRFELTVWNLPDRDESLRLPVLSLTRTLIIDDVELKPHRIGNRALFELRWREPVPLRNRRVRFWPLWRPWDPLFEQTIPDEAEGTLTFEAPPKDLRSGKYRLEFIVVDPWVPPVAPQRPQKGTPGTVDVELISAGKQLQYLNARIQKEGPHFELILERAVIRHDAGDTQGAQSDWQWCYEHLDDGTIPQILALVEMVQAAGDQRMLKALQLKMFAVRRIRRLLDVHEKGELAAEDFQTYLANLPRSRLLPFDTCELLLSVEDEKVRLYAVQQLMERNDERGVRAILEWIRAARLSDADAVALLKLNTDLAVDVLREKADDPVALRLREQIDIDVVVQPGNWVHSNAGWGRIDRIEDLEGRTVARFIPGRNDLRLYVTLRPLKREDAKSVLFPWTWYLPWPQRLRLQEEGDAESVLLDLSEQRITFLKAERVYTCTKCNACSVAQDPYLIINQHNRAAHDNICPSYRWEQATTLKLRFVKYRKKPPGNQWN